MTEASSADAARAFLSALAAGDLTGLLARLHPEVEWHVPGDRALVPWVGTWHGHDEVRRFLSVVADVAEPRAFEVRALLAEGPDVVALGRFGYHYPGTGGDVDDVFALHMVVRNGLITHYRIHEDSLAIARAYSGSPVVARGGT